MNARQLQDQLRDLLETVLFAREDRDNPARALAEHVEGIRQIATYDDVGTMTRDKGLIIETDDGAEFQLTIVESRPAASACAWHADRCDARPDGEEE
jgi:hypothetical protein